MDEQRLIDANDAILQIERREKYLIGDKCISVDAFKEFIKNRPTIDPVKHGYVLSSVHEQVQWERDIAIDQLHSYGVEFGEKAEMQRVRHGKWSDPLEGKDRAFQCRLCGGIAFNHGLLTACPYKYCPHCGAKMDNRTLEE